MPEWLPLKHPPRKPGLVSCIRCHASTINEFNRLRSWQEAGSGWSRVYRCSACAGNAPLRAHDYAGFDARKAPPSLKRGRRP